MGSCLGVSRQPLWIQKLPLVGSQGDPSGADVEREVRRGEGLPYCRDVGGLSRYLDEECGQELVAMGCRAHGRSQQ